MVASSSPSFYPWSGRTASYDQTLSFCQQQMTMFPVDVGTERPSETTGNLGQLGVITLGSSKHQQQQAERLQWANKLNESPRLPTGEQPATRSRTSFTISRSGETRKAEKEKNKQKRIRVEERETEGGSYRECSYRSIWVCSQRDPILLRFPGFFRSTVLSSCEAPDIKGPDFDKWLKCPRLAEERICELMGTYIHEASFRSTAWQYYGFLTTM